MSVEVKGSPERSRCYAEEELESRECEETVNSERLQPFPKQSKGVVINGFHADSLPDVRDDPGVLDHELEVGVGCVSLPIAKLDAAVVPDSDNDGDDAAEEADEECCPKRNLCATDEHAQESTT